MEFIHTEAHMFWKYTLWTKKKWIGKRTLPNSTKSSIPQLEISHWDTRRQQQAGSRQEWDRKRQNSVQYPKKKDHDDIKERLYFRKAQVMYFFLKIFRPQQTPVLHSWQAICSNYQVN